MIISNSKVNLHRLFEIAFSKLLSEKAKKIVELKIILIAIASFFIHLALIFLVDLDLIVISDPSTLLTNPISAIYTPFSFILIYEVYLLIYYLPKSITFYIGKQYEIITLILIRRLFKDLAELELTPNWFKVPGDLVFTYDLITTVVLFFLILVFYNLNQQKDERNYSSPIFASELIQFVRLKNGIATLLVPVFIGVACYSMYDWLYQNFFSGPMAPDKMTKLDGIFFDRFFTLLILVDVLLLLISFIRSDRFSMVIRNSGFVISTILIKISFGTEGLLNNILIITAVFFGVTILWIHNKYERLPYSS